MQYAIFSGNRFTVNGATFISVVNSPAASVIVGSQVGNAFVGATPTTAGTLFAALSGGDLGFGLALDPRGLGF